MFYFIGMWWRFTISVSCNIISGLLTEKPTCRLTEYTAIWGKYTYTFWRATTDNMIPFYWFFTHIPKSEECLLELVIYGCSVGKRLWAGDLGLPICAGSHVRSVGAGSQARSGCCLVLYWLYSRSGLWDMGIWYSYRSSILGAVKNDRPKMSY